MKLRAFLLGIQRISREKADDFFGPPFPEDLGKDHAAFENVFLHPKHALILDAEIVAIAPEDMVSNSLFSIARTGIQLVLNLRGTRTNADGSVGTEVNSMGVNRKASLAFSNQLEADALKGLFLVSDDSVDEGDQSMMPRQSKYIVDMLTKIARQFQRAKRFDRDGSDGLAIRNLLISQEIIDVSLLLDFFENLARGEAK